MTERSSKTSTPAKGLSREQQAAFFVVFAIVTFTLVGGGLWVAGFVLNRTTPTPAPLRGTSLIYINYDSDTSAYLSAESLLGMGKWLQEQPEPINVQVLTGMSTAEIAGYMVYQVSAGLQVDCSYCHNVNDFSADQMDDPAVTAAKATAREHLRMSADLNQNWLTQLSALSEEKKPSGAQITCATCHNGQPKFETWEPVAGLPRDFRLPIGNLDILKVNAREDIGLETVQYNQYVMYHMNISMNVGCTHCHNSRYFPSNERPSKLYALHMLQMTEYIQLTYSDVIAGKELSCTMCHQGAILPPGAAKSVREVPAVLSSSPPVATQ